MAARNARRSDRRPAAPVAPDDGPLSVQRAFVVHFAATIGRARRRFTGRVEHLPTGEAASFASLAGLLGFVARMIATRRAEEGEE